MYRKLSILIFLISFFLLSCSSLKVKNHSSIISSKNIEVPVAIHLRSDQYDPQLLSFFWKQSKVEFYPGNIYFVIDSIVFDSPFANPNITGRDRKIIQDMSDSRVHIYFVDSIFKKGEDANLNGVFMDDGICRKSILISSQEEVTLDIGMKTIAHEIGHFFGLNHEPDNPFNIMNVLKVSTRDPDAHFSKKQLQVIRHNILRRQILCFMPKAVSVNSRL